MSTLRSNRGHLPHTFLTRAVCILLAALFLSACHLDMYQQPKAKPLGESQFFPDKSNMRPLLPNTVARNQNLPDALTTGRVNGNGEYVTDMPIELNEQSMARGKERYTIYCAPCHGDKGTGVSAVSSLFNPRPVSFFDQRVVDLPNGYYFEVITNGKGAMYQYRSRIQNPNDRWAIINYIREMQKNPPTPTPVPQPTAAATPAAEATPVAPTPTAAP